MSGTSAMFTLKPGATITRETVAAALEAKGLTLESFGSKQVTPPGSVWVLAYTGLT